MLQMTKGCYVPLADKLCEQYSEKDGCFTANINGDKIEKLMREYISMQKEKVFFILELPANEADEKKLRQNSSDPMHKDVYYMDFLTAKEANELLDCYGDLLINDGLSCCGFGCHDDKSEIMKNKYNEITVWTTEPQKYHKLMRKYAPETQSCKTAWETFSDTTAGECISIELDGISVYDLPERLRSMGLYLAEQREE